LSETDEAPVPSPSQALISRLWGSDALVIASATLIGYSLLFTYEAGFCAYYAIPYSLIALNLVQGFSTVAALVLAAFFVLQMGAPFAAMFFAEIEGGYLGAAATVFSAFLVGLILLREGANGLVIVAGMVAVAFVMGRWYLPTLARTVRTARSIKKFAESPSVAKSPSTKAAFAVSLFLVALIIAFVSGRGEAVGDPKFVARVGSQQYLVLRFYGDNIVTVPFTQYHRESIRVQGGLRIFKVGDSALGDLGARPDSPIVTQEQATKEGVWGWLFPYRASLSILER
jgi:hypothetical protein